MNVNSLDLNLIYVFDSIYKTRSVSKSAAELGLSQPALSNALMRLRRTINDELFVRSKSGMIPTKKSLEIYPLISTFLSGVKSQVLTKQLFDIKTSTKCFSLCATDNELLTYIKYFICSKEVAQSNLSFKLSFPNPFDFFERMEQGKCDLSFGVDIPYRSNFEYEDIYSQKYVCIAKKALSSSRKISLKKYLEQNHILVSPLGGSTGPVDLKLQELSIKRNISLIIPSFSLLPDFLINRDLIVTLPESIGREYASVYKLNLYHLPFDLDLIKMQMVWHKSLSLDGESIWLRSKIREFIKSL